MTAAAETFTITNKLGIHARAAAAFVKMANRFSCSISITKDSVTVNGKSIMGVLMLAAAKGTAVKIEATGPDAQRAISELGMLIKDKFGEDE